MTCVPLAGSDLRRPGDDTVGVAGSGARGAVLRRAVGPVLVPVAVAAWGSELEVGRRAVALAGAAGGSCGRAGNGGTERGGRRARGSCARPGNGGTGRGDVSSPGHR